MAVVANALLYRLDGRRPAPPRHSPLLGGDNAAVYCELLGISEADYRELEAGGVFK